ncbi:plant intracellular Ras-group-related LRR protein 7-like isoform X3 [Limulus polyphemus]|uniref:Plant intracellular Ras-group-related LRR protein 7-like isoform X3 n=1 Tax=Limulus polyphemus TaxID=6850 RepID=A0ABM1S7M8_LIMPO|nr:plant intracellular Ras-group-related LRR protein 7-like isoform X3 [Limulus polyphemus]
MHHENCMWIKCLTAYWRAYLSVVIHHNYYTVTKKLMSVGPTLASIPVNPIGIMAGKAVTKVVKRCQYAKEEQNLDLNLANNRLSSLPEELRDLSNLKRLDISQNDYMLFPKVVFKLPNLIFLNAQKNHITSIDVEKLKSIRSLREVNFEDNPLTNVSREQLKSMESVVVTVHVNPPVDEDSEDDIMNLENVSPSGGENRQ